MKLWNISEVAGLYCCIAERFSGLGSDLTCAVVSCVLRYITGIRSSDMLRWNLSYGNTVNGSTDTAGIYSILAMNAIIMPY